MALKVVEVLLKATGGGEVATVMGQAAAGMDRFAAQAAAAGAATTQAFDSATAATVTYRGAVEQAAMASAGVAETAQANVAALIEQNTVLAALAAEYRAVAVAAEEGSAQQAAAAHLAADANKRLAASGVEVETAAAGMSQKVSMAAVGVVAAFGFMAVQGIKQFTELANEVRAFQRVTGASAESSSQLVYALGHLGIGADQAATLMGRFARNLVDHADKMSALGITTARTKDGQVDLIGSLYNAADAFQKLGPGAEGSTLAIDAFGKAGIAIIPVLQRGREGLKEFFDEAKAHGLVFNQQDLDDARNLTLATRDLHSAFQGFEISLAKDVIPALTTFAHTLSGIIDAAQALHLPIGEIVLVGTAAVLASKGVTALAGAFGIETAAAEAATAANVGAAASQAVTGAGAVGGASKVGLFGAALGSTVGQLVIYGYAVEQAVTHQMKHVEATDKNIGALGSLDRAYIGVLDHIPLIGHALADHERHAISDGAATKDHAKATQDSIAAYTQATTQLKGMGVSLDEFDMSMLTNEKTAKQVQTAVDNYATKIGEDAGKVGLSSAALANAVGISGERTIAQFAADEAAANAFVQAVTAGVDAASKAFLKSSDAVDHFSASALAGAAKGANSVEQADNKLADAEQRVADLQVQFAEQAASAKEAWAQKVEDNNRQVADSEANYSDVVESQNQRVADSEQRLADQRIALAQAVEDAKARLAQDTESGAQAVKDAEQRLRDLQERNSASTPAQAAAISKAQELRKAQEDVDKARQRAADQQKKDQDAIAKAQQDQIRGIAKAEQDLADARKQQVKSVASAEEQVTKAKEEQNKLAVEGQTIGALTLSQQRQLRDAVTAVTRAQEGQASGFMQIGAAQTEAMHVTTDEVRAFYQHSLEEGQKFSDGIRLAIQKGYDPGFISRILEEGPTEAAPILEAIANDQDNTLRDLVNRSELAIDQMNTHIREVARLTFLATHSTSDQMNLDFKTAMGILEANAGEGGKKTADAIASKLGIGVENVSRIAAEYGISLAEGINPVLVGVGVNSIAYSPAKPLTYDPSSYTFRAEGGPLPDEAKYQPAGTMVQWAEPETGGEWFLPDAEAKRARSLSIASDMLDRWGYAIKRKEFATGGFFMPEDVPHPPDYSGYGDKVGYTADKADHYLYDKVVEYVRAHMGGTGYGFQALIDYLNNKGIPNTVTSTTGGGHAEGSRHYMGLAADFVSANMAQIGDAFMAIQPSMYELIHNPGYSIKAGQRVDPSYWGADTWAEHLGHVHAATYTGPSEGPGIPVRGGAGGAYGAAPTDVSGAVALGRQMAAARGWTGAEWDALYALWQQESGWNANAVNPSSGAYGIPQALPAAQGHPYELGDARAQIEWGDRYIAGRYSDPINAEQHELDFGWYARGGNVDHDGLGYLHKREMVLPKDLSDFIRRAAVAPGASGATSTVNTGVMATSRQTTGATGAVVNSISATTVQGRTGERPVAVVDHAALAQAITRAMSSTPSADAIARAVGDVLSAVLPGVMPRDIKFDGRVLGEFVSTSLRGRGIARSGMR